MAQTHTVKRVLAALSIALLLTTCSAYADGGGEGDGFPTTVPDASYSPSDSSSKWFPSASSVFNIAIAQSRLNSEIAALSGAIPSLMTHFPFNVPSALQAALQSIHDSDTQNPLGFSMCIPWTTGAQAITVPYPDWVLGLIGDARMALAFGVWYLAIAALVKNWLGWAK